MEVHRRIPFFIPNFAILRSNPLALIVQKYGGSSVGDADKIKHVAKRVIAAQNAGNQVVVVV